MSYNLLQHILFPPTWFNNSKLEKAVSQKTILITGASFGIGEALAHLLAPTGALLLLVARTEEKLVLLQEKLEKKGARVRIFAVDLTKEEEIDTLIGELQKLSGGLDIVVSNAGRSIRRPIMESLERFHDFERTMAINYFAPVRLLLPLIPLLQQNKGQIINVSAVNVLMAPAAYWAAYQASKSAFDQWFRAAMPEFEAQEIACTSIYLPLVKTRMIAPTKIYEKVPAMSPEHVAKTIGRCIYTRQRKFAPWWAFWGALASVIFRGLWEFFSSK